ncbi:MAG TPA: CehA/McbA family metallohydrolase [Anaerolineae bacterium]
MAVLHLINPYLQTGQTFWLKGNLHTHTTMSDGELTPAQAIAAYERLGYDFLAISDHDTYIAPSDYQAGTKLILVPGVEVTAMGPHVLQIGIEERLEPLADRQKVLDQINARKGLAILNHPNWEWHYNHFPQELMQDLQGAAGLEVYNGVIERLEGSALATDRWDRLLSQNKWLWGYANDDAHLATDIGVAWNVVQVNERTPAAIIDALRRGHFYPSTGVVIRDVQVNGSQFTVRTENAQRIRFITRWGVIRASVDGMDATYQVPDDPVLAKALRYVRAECYGSGGRMAWTQPVRLEVQ